jgi:glycosyltransferase involved in cell wall biosynthesis
MYLRWIVSENIVSEGNLRPLRVLHIVSSGGVTTTTQQSLFMPLLTRMPKARLKTQVVALAVDAVPSAVLRQGGVPVHDVALSRKNFSAVAIKDLLNAANLFRPDVLQAWGHSAQIAAAALRARCDWCPQLLWSVTDTAPLPLQAGLIDRQKLKLASRLSTKPNRIVYTSEASASAHRRVGFPEGGHEVITPGVDPMRFKPDFAARRKVREQLGLSHDTFVVGMMAPFQPEFDHVTLLRAIGELIKTTPNLAVLLAGHGVQKGNGPLMALVGGGTLGTRTQLLGEWSDMSSFYNACDVACSSALNDTMRMNLVAAMLCGVPCVATGMGAQGELLGQYGVAVEKGSPNAMVRGITRIMQLAPERRAFMVKNARKYALDNFVHVRSMQKYLQLYFDLVGREALATNEVPAEQIDESIPEPTAEELAAARAVKINPNAKLVSLAELADPDSLESKARIADTPIATFTAPPPRPEVLQPPKPEHEGDVLHSFESSLSTQQASGSPMSERARGVADDLGDLLSPESLQSDEPAGPRPTLGPSRSVAKDKNLAQPPISIDSRAPIKVPQNPAAFAPLELVPDPTPPLARTGNDLS